MKLESIAYAIAGMCFGILLGWVLGAQHGAPSPGGQPAASQPAQTSAQQREAPPLNLSRVQELTRAVENDPKNVAALTELGNLYFDAERFNDAIQWYERSLTIDPNNADVSTDLGVSYYYTNRPDQALRQFEHSLKLNPSHAKTWFNKGIVLAFGKEDMKGAVEAWQRVVELAPDSREGQAARRALEGIAAAHPDGAGVSTNQ